MKMKLVWLVVIVVLSVHPVRSQKNTSSPSPSVQLVTVENNVKLEVLDWGGSGRPLVLLAGMGGTAHVFGQFAPKFTANYHVYGITRRGFGASSQPAPTVANYSADRLGDDILAVVDALKLDRPVLVGHSIAGEELSSIGSRHPEKVAGLIYLEAGYGYAYYDRVHGDVWLDLIDMKNQIDELQSGTAPDKKKLWQEMLTTVSHLQTAMQEITKDMATGPSPPPLPPIVRAVQFGQKKYTEIHVPILAIFAAPVASDVHSSRQIQAFQAGLPSAHVVSLRNADHFIFRSNEAQVFREMNEFLEKLR